MKTIFAAILLFATATSFAQKKDDNSIVINAAGITDEQIKTALITSGYGIVKSDPGYFLTDETGKKGVSVKLSILKKDTIYLLQGRMNTNIELWGVKSDWSTIINKGAKTSPMQKAWNEMITVARKITDKVEFTKL